MNSSDNALGYTNRGMIFGMQGKPDEALRDFNKAISIEPDNYLAHKNRAYLYQISGKNKEAISDYEVMLKTAPDKVPVYYWMAECYKADGAKDKAAEYYRKGISILESKANLNNEEEEILKMLKTKLKS